MPNRVTRRTFVAGSAGVVATGACWRGSESDNATVGARPSGVRSTGRSATRLEGVPDEVSWEATGGSRRLTLTLRGVELSLPTRSPMFFELAQLEAGIGHQEIRGHFGHGTLTALLGELPAWTRDREPGTRRA